MPQRIFGHVGKAFRDLVPPTAYFFVAFNLIVFTTNLMVHDYWFKLSAFLLATTTALIVGKAVLVANHIRWINLYRGAPLIQPILYKTIFYTLVVFVVRVIERFLHLAFDAHGLTWALDAEVETFNLHRFVAVQIWIFTTFFVYVTATEIGYLMGEGQLLRLLFRHRSSEHRLTRRQHVRALMELSRLAETTPRDQLLDPSTVPGRRLITIVDALRQRHVPGPQGRPVTPGPAVDRSGR
jgi:hypothetical protein